MTANGAEGRFRERRAVVTGLGAVTAAGPGADALWEAAVAGRSVVTELSGVDSAGAPYAELPVRIGGRIRGFDAGSLRPELPSGLARRLSDVQLWGIAAADEALRQALRQLTNDPEDANRAPALPWDPARVAVIAATGSGPIQAMQEATRALDARGSRAVPLALSVYGAPDAAAAILSQRYGIEGPAQGLNATCASGAIALGEGLRRIRHGYADAVLVVGMEDCLGAVNLASNANLRALAAGYEGDPAAASRPFDRARAGFVMSQGAAAILLESEDAARARGAESLAVLAGFGASSDAHHATAPHPEGRGAARAVRECLADAGLGSGFAHGVGHGIGSGSRAEAFPDDAEGPALGASFGDGAEDDALIAAEFVDHINAHGTGTEAGDAAELRALAAALGDRAREIPISATKSSTGHLLGAAGIAEAILAIRTLRERLLPPTINLQDPEFPGWDFVTDTARPATIETVLSTSFGFGGHNGAVLFTRATEEETE